MNKWTLLLGLAVALCLGFGGLTLVGHASTTQAPTLDWSVVGAGGNASAQLASTVGQTAIGWSSGAQQLGSGFWYGAAAPYRVFLPLLLRKQ